MTPKHLPNLALTATIATLAAPLPVTATTVLSGDHSVTGNLCVGADCTNSESFGSYPLKLKGGILGIKFEDTSTGPSEPTHDWDLMINESHLYGQPSISIHDGQTGFQVFKIEGYAPANSIYVDDEGFVGFQTALPMTDLHVYSPDTPTLRLEQNATSYDPQIWDLSGNEANFFIHDATNDLTPFQVQPGSGNDNALTIAGNGRIGIGTVFPNAALHLKHSDGTTRFLVEETSSTVSPRPLLNLKNTGRPEIVMANTSTNGEWSFGAGTKFILKQGAVGSASSAKTKLFEIDASGNATLAGTLTTGGTTCGTGCDAVFAPDYPLPSITDHAAQMQALGYLPNVGPTPEGAPFDVTDKLGRMLNELEHAHLYIAQQEGRIARLEAQLATVLADRD